MSESVLSAEDIASIAPRRIIEYVIKGIMKEHQLSISVMLDVDETDLGLSSGTGRIFVTDRSDYEPYCSFLRTNPNKEISRRCPLCDRQHFQLAKEKVCENPGYAGEIYICSSGLWNFTVPIVEEAGNTFIGIILGGQKRPKESKR